MGEQGLGKTTLVREFIKNKKCFYYGLHRTLEQLNCHLFLQEAQLQGWAEEQYTWQGVLNKLARRARGESLVLVLDNCEHLASCMPCLLEELVQLLKTRENLRLFVLLVGELAGEAWPLELRKQANLELELGPLTYLEALPLLEPFEEEEKVLLYGMTGGYPAYLALVDTKQSCKENVQRLFFGEQAPLALAAENLLQRKLREPATYQTILYSIAQGAERLSIISQQVGMEMNKLSKYMKTLVDLGLVCRINPITNYKEKKQQKKTYYVLQNSLLEFYYRFVLPYGGLLALGRGNGVLRQQVAPQLDSYLGRVFQRLCLQYCHTLAEREDFAFAYEALGYWWQEEGSLVESLLLALQKKKACCMVCVWENGRTSMETLERLMQVSQALPPEEKYYLIFSRKRFQNNLLAYSAQQPNIRLISLSYIK